MLTVEERYELFKSTLLKCCSDILSKNDDDFRYTLFEELPIDIISFLHNKTLAQCRGIAEIVVRIVFR